MFIGLIFEHNHTQAVRLPSETQFPPEVKTVVVRMRGNERILTPAGYEWDSFFNAGECVTDDFEAERASQLQGDREPF
jgi:antitoxin VapB